MKLTRASELEVKPYVISKRALQERRKRFLAARIFLVFLGIFALFSFQHRAEATMITSNIIYRTFHIQWNDATGTGFTIDHNSKQYLITARHVVHGIESGNAIKTFHDEVWKNLVVNVVGSGKGDVDVTVLASTVSI